MATKRKKKRAKQPRLKDVTLVKRSVTVEKTPRLLQVCGMFDVPQTEVSEVEFEVSLMNGLHGKEWQIGCVVGASGSGKTTIINELFGEAVIGDYDWHPNRSVLDEFPEHLNMKQITNTLSRVGFSSPPNWLRPFHVLSMGEQFRTHLARVLLESRELAVVDEFTSVVDRTVAKVGSDCIARLMRSGKAAIKQLVVATCHYDVIDWLQPDWLYEVDGDTLTWRSLQRRPAIKLSVRPVHYAAWHLFSRHHYLTKHMHKSARCYVGTIDGRPAVIATVLPVFSGNASGFRISRVVTMPDFQGLGLGPHISDFVAACYHTVGRKFYGTTAHPSLMRVLLNSPKWRTVSEAKLRYGGSGDRKRRDLRSIRSWDRMVASFEYIGPRIEDVKLAEEFTGQKLPRVKLS